jgi:hypothetical protein
MRWLLVVVCLLLAGCTMPQPGEPTPVNEPAGTTTTTAPAPTTTTTGASRPKNIDMAAIDICKVFTGLPLTTIGIDTDRAPLGGDSGVFPGSKQCSGNGLGSNLSLILVAVVNRGAADYAEGVTAKVDRTEVAGFPFYVLTPSNPESCFGVVDVHDGQMLNINYGIASSSSQPVTPQATLCQRVTEIATAALAQL